MRNFGLIGFPLEHSFSPAFFKSKFERENLSDCVYTAFPINRLEDIPAFLNQRSESLIGFNVTIPYKQSIIPFLDEIDEHAAKIAAVNTVKRIDGKWKGFNTDYFGFKKSIGPFLDQNHERALVLGSGGAAKAIIAVLNDIGVQTLTISRKSESINEMAYSELGPELMKHFKLIINTTPLGTFPDIDSKAPIPYDCITQDYLLYDLVYNPAVTAFMKEGLNRGARAVNGYNMLVLQAEKAWEIWNS